MTVHPTYATRLNVATNGFQGIPNLAGSCLSRLNRLANALMQSSGSGIESVDSVGSQGVNQDYQNLAGNLSLANLEAAKKMGKLHLFAAYLISVLRQYEERFFDDLGYRRTEPDLSVLHGYGNDKLLTLLRGTIKPTFKRLTYEADLPGLPISASISADQNPVRTFEGNNYTLLRIPQALALLNEIDADKNEYRLATLFISPSVRRQVIVVTKKDRTEVAANPRNIEDALNALTLEVGVEELSRILGRAAQPNERLLLDLIKS